MTIMAEEISGAQGPEGVAQCGESRGLRYSRRNTTPGSDPLDAVRWEPMEVAVEDRVAGQRKFGAVREFPRGYSLLAGSIIGSKYMRRRGVGGADQGETSMRQVVRRITQALQGQAHVQGLFGDSATDASRELAESFGAELAHLMVHQYAAFNSPVWFNAGLRESYGISGTTTGNFYWDRSAGAVAVAPDAYTHPANSACFILGLGDDLMSIFDWYRNEARIFKWGGGSGTSLDALRGRDEPLSGGGESSGAMAWADVGDRAAGATKSRGTTRRAVTMRIMSMDHPDIVDFIEWKVREEKKAQALIAAGYPADFNGEAYRTVSGQNSNNSVRVTDEFMRAVEAGGEWSTRLRTTGAVAKTYRAADLWRKVAEAAWRCADPGVQFDDVIQAWHTCPNAGRINASNPCSEYVFIDDSACNLSSINLGKFVQENFAGEVVFDVEGFRHAVRTMVLAMEAIVDYSSYPTRRIAENSHRFRTLGIGYANLGSLLMECGLPYDSPQARETAAAISAIMTAEAYRTSAELARCVGPFEGFAANREPMLRVIRKHREAARGLDPSLCTSALYDAANRLWDEAEELGEMFGYRNAQVSLLAPTGTIAFAMDCDTTGIEPDYALVKSKRLAGGGLLKQVNATVPKALRRLGYTASQIDDVVTYLAGTPKLEGAPSVGVEFLRSKGLLDEEIERVERALSHAFYLEEEVFSPYTLGEAAVRRLGLTSELAVQADGKTTCEWREGFRLLAHWGLSDDAIEAASNHLLGHMTVEGAPQLRAEHLPVFDCANRCGRSGKRFISAFGHVDMMARVSVFLSGAISKTVNMPRDATVEDIMTVYAYAWKTRAVKALAVYRDGCKASQPLNASSARHADGRTDTAMRAILSATEPDLLAAFTVSPESHLASLNRLAREALGEPVRDASEYTAVRDRMRSATARAVAPKPASRVKLPARRSGFTQEARIGGHKIFVRTGEYENGQIGELFVDVSKGGSALRSVFNAFAIAVSIGLQHGVPAEQYVNAFQGIQFDPQGPVVGDARVRFSASFVDYIARLMGTAYCGRDDLAHLSEGSAPPDALEDPAGSSAMDAAPRPPAFKVMASGNYCGECGGIMVRTGTCEACPGCGKSNGSCS